MRVHVNMYNARFILARAGVTAVWNFIAKFSQDEWDASFKCIFDSLDLDGDGEVVSGNIVSSK